MDPEPYIRLGLALGIGLLIGLQRERSKEFPAGIRTFALIALSGYIVGLLAGNLPNGSWIVAAGLFFLGVILGLGTYINFRREKGGAGVTTEIAALLIFGIGVYLVRGDKSIAVVSAGLTALILHYKESMHRFVRGLGEEDLRAIMQFVLITLVILPVLPNRTFGPYDVLNPFKAWLMVALIVGIGLLGYVTFKMFGGKKGTLLSGLLGGMISSTATTVSSSRASAENPNRSSVATLIIMIASAVAIVRVLIEMAVVNPLGFSSAAPPIAVFLAAFVVLTIILYRWRSPEVVHLDPPDNPAELKPAVIFGILYVVILLAIAFAREHLGQGGLYAVAVISGLTDMDAITLSTAELMQRNNLPPSTGWRVILTAALANLVFKGGVVAVVGSRPLFKRIALFYGIAIAAGLGLIFLWP